MVRNHGVRFFLVNRIRFDGIEAVELVLLDVVATPQVHQTELDERMQHMIVSLQIRGVLDLQIE